MMVNLTSMSSKNTTRVQMAVHLVLTDSDVAEYCRED